MIFLTVDGAIFHEVTCAMLEFYIINFHLAARSTHLLGLLCAATHYCNDTGNLTAYCPDCIRMILPLTGGMVLRSVD